MRRYLRAATHAWRQVPLMAAVAGAALLLAVSAAAAPVFASSARSGSVAAQLASYCPWSQSRTAAVDMTGPITGTAHVEYPVAKQHWTSGPRLHDVELTRDATALWDDRMAWLDRRLAAVPHLARRAEVSVLASTVQPSWHGRAAIRATPLLYRDGARAHLAFTDRVGGPGVWLSDTTASDMGARAGDTVTLRLGTAATTARVAGVYRTLATTQPRDPFWCSLGPDLYAKSIFDTAPPPPVIVPTLAELRGLLTALHAHDAADVRYERQVLLPLTAAQATATATAVATALDPLTEFPPPPGVGRLGQMQVQPFGLGEVADIARQVGAGISAPVDAIADAGSGVALLLVAAVATLWVDRRRSEVLLLSSRGVGPVAVAGQAVAETFAAYVVGSLAGWAVGVTVVAGLGPGHVLDAGTRAAAADRAAAVCAVGLLVLAAGAGLAARHAGEAPVGRARRWPGLVPWELAVVAAAALLYWAGGRHGLDVSAAWPTLPPIQLAFLLVGLSGGVLLGVRACAGLISLTRGRGRSWPNAGYLAVRRLAASLRVSALFVATVALPVGVLVAAHVLVATLRTTEDAKALVFIGTDTVFDVENSATAPPPQLAGRATVVDRVEDATLDGQDVQVLAVDPAGFPAAAFWDGRFADRPLAALMSAITVRRPGAGPVPALVTGLPVTGTATLHLPGTSSAGSEHGTNLDVTVVGRPRAFPGRKNTPLVVIDRTVLPTGRVLPQTELWVPGPTPAAERAVAAAGWPVQYEISLPQVSRAPDLVVVTWTFAFLEGVAVLIGLVAVGGLLLYLHVRQRRTRLTYAFARRMGLSRAGHLVSVLTETAAMLLAAFALGAGTATAAAWVIHGRLDPEPLLPPAPLFTLTPAVYAWAGGCCAAVALVAAVMVQVGAERTNNAELLRLPT